jgi:hypothetical protein
MIPLYPRNVLMILCGALALSGCAATGAVNAGLDAGGGCPAWEDLDGLSGATIAKVTAGSFAYVDRVAGAYTLKTVHVDRPRKPAAQTPLGDNAALVTSLETPGGSLVAVLGAGTGGLPRTLRVYDQNLRPLGKDITFPGAPLNHPEGAVALTEKYLVSGFAEGDTTCIGVFDIRGNRPPSRTDTSALIGRLVTLAAWGDYVIAGGSGGTAVYRIESAGMELIPVSASDGKRSHWMKNNGLYVMESKEEGAEVKIWRWGNGVPEAPGSVTVPDTAAGMSAAAVKALQFDDEDPHTAYMVSATGGLVYQVDLAGAAVGEAAKTLLFSYPKHDAGSATHEFFAWMIERVRHSDSSYFVITGGYGSMENPRGAAGVALVFEDPVPGSVSPAATVYYGGRVRSLRSLEDSAGNRYFAAKDSPANKLGVYRIN